MNKFCGKCGERLTPDTPPEYDRDTGEMILRVCPTGKCGHDGIGCWTQAHPERLFNGGHVGPFVGGNWFKAGKCAACGEKQPVFD